MIHVQVEDYSLFLAHVHSLEVLGFCDLKAIDAADSLFSAGESFY
jgi:hypothetical protein